MLSLALLFLALASLQLVEAKNDWAVACRGECAYDLPETAGSGTVKISGSTHAVSDISPAGGWRVLACDTEAQAQEIRLVCATSACEHLFEGHGAVDTVVRLPESCGPNPFARVASVKVDADQSLPSALKANILHGGNMTSTVFLLTVDTDFTAVDPNVTGPVSFKIEGYNYQVALDGEEDSDKTKRDAETGLKIRDNITSYNHTTSTDPPPLKIDQTFPIFSASVQCTNFTATVSTSFDVDVDLTVSLGLIVAGTVIPPNITQFSVFGGLDGSTGGRLEVVTSALGTYSTGKVSLYSVALAGVDVPGIFTLGPTFDLFGQADATLTSGDLSVGIDLDYTVENAKVFIPAQSKSGGGFTPDNSKLTLSVLPAVKAAGNLTGHLIPQLTLGLNAFSGIATAEAYLNLDANAALGLSVEASASASTSTSGSNSTSGSVDGCVDISAGLSVDVGADGSLFGLLSGSATYPLYSGEWELYQKCFSASSKREPGTAAAPADSNSLVVTGKRASGLSCPMTSTAGKLVEIIEEIVAAVEKN
ncbi:hypothetical protein C8F01DRAFT_1047778 [Mycena amicta]|nr:hypothetical protein C8F01DRAFT_1047778 [Mycena amicta]